MPDVSAGSAGTLVASALQTAGIFFQSAVLDSFSSVFGALPVFLFVLSAVIALGSFVVTGRVKEPLFLLVGPILVLAILGNRREVSPTEWRLGNSTGRQKDVATLAEGMTKKEIKNPSVSSFFVSFDRIISSAFQNLITQLGATQANANLSVVAKTQLNAFLMSQTVSDPGLKELLHLSLLGECRGLSQAGAEMADTRNPPAERCEWARTYSELSQSTRFKLTPIARNYLARLTTDVPAINTARVVPYFESEIDRAVSQISTANNGILCDVEAGSGSTLGLDDPYTVAQRASEQTAAMRARIRAITGSNLGTSTDVEAIEREMRERNANVAAREKQLDGESFQCDLIWNYTYLALYYEAYLTTEAAREEIKRKGLDEDAVLADVFKLSGSFDVKGLVSAMARRMFRLEVATGSTSAFIAEYAGRGLSLSHIDIDANNDFMGQLRIRERQNAWRDEGRLIALASSYPYYQGLILYFLSVTFPFFVLLLIVPGQRTGFFMWCALWIWAKSWDVGYAVVTWVDEVLKTLFVVRFQNGYLKEATGLDLDFSAAVSALRDIDPTFDVSLYYTMLGACLMAIPTLLSQIILGGLVSISAATSQRMQDYNRQMGSKATAYGNSEGDDLSVIPTVYGGSLTPINMNMPVSLADLRATESRYQNAHSQALPPASNNIKQIETAPEVPSRNLDPEPKHNNETDRTRLLETTTVRIER